MEQAYARIKADRDQDEHDRLLALPPDRLREEREKRAIQRQRNYTQPFEASWREFCQKRGWTPNDVAELPDDWLYAEWGMHTLRLHYHIDTEV